VQIDSVVELLKSPLRSDSIPPSLFRRL